MRIDRVADAKKGSDAGSGSSNRAKITPAERFHTPDEIAVAEAMIEAQGRNDTLDTIEDIAARASLNIKPRAPKG